MSELLSSITRIPVTSILWEPGGAGVYAFYAQSKTPFYVGMGGDVGRRMHDHRRAGLCLAASRISVWGCSSVKAAQRLERNMILFWQPSQNDLLPSVSANEREWFHTLYVETMTDLGSGETWGHCPGCGELFVFLHGLYLQATFGHGCERHENQPHWDPRGYCWRPFPWHLAALFGFPGDEWEYDQRWLRHHDSETVPAPD